MARNKYFVKFRRPVRVDENLTAELRTQLALNGIEVPGQWQLFVTNTVRGRAARRSETITVPTWTMEREDLGVAYHIYYACHEIAHILAPATKGNVHGPEFMEAFKKVCPEELWHYELGYKPRLAKAAGIRKPE